MRARSLEQTPPPATRVLAAVRFFAFLPSVFRALAIVCAFLATAQAGATEVRRTRFNVPEGDAAVTLRQFAQQSRESVIYPIDVVRGVRTHAIHGEFAAHEAAQRMIAGTV